MSDSSHESFLHRLFLATWYQAKPNLLARCLSPFSALFFYLAAKRRAKLSRQAKPFSVPLVVVGNITVGGTGKTPVIISLANSLQAEGVNVGIVSRGYGSQTSHYPLQVRSTTGNKEAGDEALLIAKATACPVFIDADRVAAVNALLKNYPNIQIVLSDDGLQHYRLHRDFEIAVLDAQRGIGNGYGLPAGPLREPAKRLAEVNAILVNGEPSALTQSDVLQAAEYFQLKPTAWAKVVDNKNVNDIPIGEVLPWQEQEQEQEQAQGQGQGQVKAIAAIGNPARFFYTLSNLGVTFTPVTFDDHHPFTAADFAGFADDTIIMTSKDAIKCAEFAKENWWQLKVECTALDPVLQKIKLLIKN